MRIDKIASNLSQITQIKNPLEKASSGQKQKPANAENGSKAQYIVKPTDVLSTEEIMMLNQLFPEKVAPNVDRAFYSAKQTHANIKVVGSLIDTKF